MYLPDVLKYVEGGGDSHDKPSLRFCSQYSVVGQPRRSAGDQHVAAARYLFAQLVDRATCPESQITAGGTHDADSKARDYGEFMRVVVHKVCLSTYVRF